jgi:hypothetical protein
MMLLIANLPCLACIIGCIYCVSIGHSNAAAGLAILAFFMHVSPGCDCEEEDE